MQTPRLSSIPARRMNSLRQIAWEPDGRWSVPERHSILVRMPDELYEIPELADLDSGQGLIRIPMEMNVPFTPRVRALVDTAEFQRLGEISQLGLVSRVYPGARHTRFEHALGVYHNALCYLQQLRRDQRFRERVDRRMAERLIVAALLHDLGHWPFCHPIEDMELAGLTVHEAHARRFLAEGRELGAVLRREWDLDPSEILDLLVPETDSPELDLLRSILSGPIDVDKMDYLDRDSLHCGVPYGRNFDRQRLIQSLVLNERGDGLAITYKGKTAAELMVFARYVMFSEVYWHHAVRAATSMFARAFYELHSALPVAGLFEKSDAEMINELRRAGRGTPAESLLDGLFGHHRRLHKRVVEFSHDDSSLIYDRLARRRFSDLVCCGQALTEAVGQRIGRPLRPTDLLIDAPPPGREVEFEIDVYFPQQDRYRRLGEVSPVVEALARTQFDDYVKRVRVYGSREIVAEVRGLSNFEDLLLGVTAEHLD